MDLLNKNSPRTCLFCGKPHSSNECRSAKRMPLEERLQKIREARSCFNCLKGNHFSNVCRTKVVCTECKGDHHHLLCRTVSNDKKPLREINTASTYSSGFVHLQTLLIRMAHHNENFTVRALIDSGSERSYIRKRYKKLALKL